MANKQYIAITIGPIGNAMSLTDSPGALWCASALFSDLSYRLCTAIHKTWGEDAYFLSPAFDGASTSEGTSFPDRIFVSLPDPASPCPTEKLPEIISSTVEEISDRIVDTVPIFNGDKKRIRKFLKEYFQINFVIAPDSAANSGGENCILNLGDILNSLECSSALPANCTEHPLLTLFNSRTEGESSQNAYLRNCYLIKDREESSVQILDPKTKQIRDIPGIADGGSEKGGKKSRNYFAVLYADGDHIGSLLSRLPSDTDVRAFSAGCLEYNRAAAKLVSDFGGMTIYAGGDDLLCLLPLRGSNAENLLGFCQQLTQAFDDHIKKIYLSLDENSRAAIEPPSVSIGISVNYKKFPLYEALSEARSMLFAVAKNTRRSIAVSVRKGSGQSFGLLLPNEPEGTVRLLSLLIDHQWAELDELLGCTSKNAPNGNAEVSHSLHSILYSLYNFSYGFKVCSTKNICTESLFRNFFDNSSHNANRAYINIIQRICEQQRTKPSYKAILGNKRYKVECGEDALSCDFSDCTEAMLRFAKLYSEEA